MSPRASQPETATIYHEIVTHEAVPAEIIELQDYLDLEPTRDIPQSPLYPIDMRRVEEARHDPNRFEALCEQYEDLIRGTASKYFLLGGERDDLIQEAMFGFFKSVRDYDGVRASFSQFAELCVKRQVITALSTAARKKHGPLNNAVSFAEAAPNKEEDSVVTLEEAVRSPSRLPEEIVASKEGLHNLVGFILDKLSLTEHLSLTMHLGGDSYEAIAAVLDIDRKAVDNSLQRVKRKIRKHLAEEAA